MVWAECERKDSLLFIHLLDQIKRIYRRVRWSVLNVDNFIIHKSSIIQRWLRTTRCSSWSLNPSITLESM